MAKELTVVLGRRYKCKVHGVEGVAVAVTEYLHGCNRVALEYVDKNGELKQYHIDVPQVEEVKKARRADLPPKVKGRGGPGDMIPKPGVVT